MTGADIPATIQVPCPHCNGELHRYSRSVVKSLFHRDRGGQLENRMMGRGQNRMVGGQPPAAKIARQFTCPKTDKPFVAQVPSWWQ